MSEGWYQVRIAGEDVSADNRTARLHEPLPPGAVIHIVPRMEGAKSGWFGVLAGVALVSETAASGSAAKALASQQAAKISEDSAAISEATASNEAASATKDAQRAETARTAAETAAASVDAHEAPSDGICYVRQNGDWVQQGAFDVGISASAGEVDALTHQLFTLDGTPDNVVTFTNLPAGRASVLALVFKGQGGTITWPDNLTWSQNEIPRLATTRTVISVLWDGETLTGTTALTV
ncbi:tail assembly protein [Salmonella enterica]|nr:tail assembly protein [Salmonella enterica]